MEKILIEMIKDKKTLEFYIKADQVMNGVNYDSLKKKIVFFFKPTPIVEYLKVLRYVEYYSNNKSILGKIGFYWYRYRLQKLGIKLGFSISPNVLGYGCVIPHYGTIVVGNGNKIGNYCVLHTSTCVTEGKKKIGDGFYLSTGAKVYKDLELGDNVSVAPNSVVNKSFGSNCTIAGIPATQRRADTEPWYIRDGKEYANRVNTVEMLKLKMNVC